MDTLTYRLDHDLGFAPNPFFNWCSLACCKHPIRRNAAVGDIIVGMAGADGLGHIYRKLIYWMRVDEALGFDQYWVDPRFENKRPRIDGPKICMVGDAIYHHDVNGGWVREESMHFRTSDANTAGHCETDTSADRVLVGQSFTYWGGEGPEVPDHLLAMFTPPRGYKRQHSEADKRELHALIGLDTPRGLVGMPADWNNSDYFHP